MEEWKEYRLGEICKVINGRAYKQEELLNEGKYKVLRVGNIFQGNKWYYSDLELPDSKYCYNGDLLYAWSCDFAPYIWHGDKTIYHYHIWKLEENKDVVDRQYLYYYLQIRTKSFLGGTHGSVMLHMTKKDMEDQILSLPSLSSQKRIASILSSLDDKIALNRKINSNLEEQAKALFKSWFIDFEPFKDGKFVESEFGMIPERWNMMSFESFISESQNKAMVGTYPAYSVTNNGITPRTEKFKKQLSKVTSKEKVLRKDDLVFGMSRQILNWGIMQDEIGSVSSAYHVYKIDKGKTNPTYLRYFIKGYESYFRDLIGTAAREGQSLDKGALMNKKLLVPSKDILRSFIQHVTTIENTISLFKSQCRRLSTLRDTLLPRLMSGEIEVKS